MLGWDDALIASVGVGLIALLRSVPAKLWNVFLYHNTRKVTLYDDDPGFIQLCDWMRQRLPNPRTFRLNWIGERIVSNPGLGIHYFKHGKTWVFVKREIEKEKLRVQDKITITFLSKSIEPMEALLEILRKDREFRVHIATEGWFLMYERPKRQLSTIHSNHGQFLLKECQEFLDRKDWFVENGIPHRRAFMLHGKPRTGKTSMVWALASELNMQVYIIDPGSCTDANFNRLMNQVPAKSIILLDDIQPEVESSKSEKEQSGVSAATLRGSLDGLAAPTGVVIFATTNHYGKLSEALKQRFEPIEFPPLDTSKLTEEQMKVLSAGQNHYALKKVS